MASKEAVLPVADCIDLYTQLGDIILGDIILLSSFESGHSLGLIAGDQWRHRGRHYKHLLTSPTPSPAFSDSLMMSVLILRFVKVIWLLPDSG